MKQIKKLSALAAGVVALGLLLGASTALAANVVVNGKGYVTKIKKLKVVDDTGVTTKYKVKFIYDTALNLYGGKGFDFKSEEKALAALIATQKALNKASPPPKRAGSVGTKQFFIGQEVEQNVFVAGAGAEWFKSLWDECELDCIAGVGTGRADEPYTFAIYKKLK